MQLLTGPAGSGKTFSALEALRAALRRGDWSARLLAPTATMAQHLRNEMAREGFVFPPSMIQTIARFIVNYVEDLPEVSEAVLHLLVAKSVRRLNLPQFAKVAHLAGFHAKLATVIEECASAGCDAKWLDGALGQVFEETNRALDARKLALRSTRFALAATRIAETGAGPAKSIWLDGFFSLSDPELAVVQAMAKHARVTVTLPSDAIASDTRARLVAMGFAERALTHARVPPARKLVVAPGIEREADEIARGIIEQAAEGRLFREIGVIVRNHDVYASLLRATFERFGIPARFYFDAVLMEQAAVRYVAGAVDAMLGGWQHDQTLAAMKLAPGAGISAPMDRFDFEVRKRMPGAGIEPLRELAAAIQNRDQRLHRLVAGLAELDGWRPLRLTATQWSIELMKLRALYHPPRPRDGVSTDTVLEARSQAQALDAFETAIEEAARSFDGPARLPLAEFWPAVKTALQLTPLRLTDQRRNVVHVLSAHEARQWELPIVFVCGLVEGQFPLYHAPDPLLPERARRRLQERGLRIRTASDLERAEQFLFDSALHLATELVVMSYPKNDPRGEQNLPSLFLDPAERPIDVSPVRAQAASPQPATAPAAVFSADLLQVIGQRHREVRPTALEAYLQCPFQFFARHTLELEGRPVRPEDRLEFRACGNIVHKVIAEWLVTRGPVDEIFERVFSAVSLAECIPAGYKTELLRARMLGDLRRFTETDSWPADLESHSELKYRFELDGGLVIRCRVDRLVRTTDGRAFVIDYKYSKKKVSEYMSATNLLQGPLYWMAAGQGPSSRAAGMYYCMLRDKVEYGGWGETPAWLPAANIQPFTPEWLNAALERSALAAREIAAGRILPAPSDISKCRFCDFKDVCRYEGVTAEIAEGA